MNLKVDTKAYRQPIYRKATSNQLIAAAAEAIKSLTPKWENVLTAVNVAVAEDFGKETLNTLKPKSAPAAGEHKALDFSTAAMQQWLTDHIATSVGSILATEIAGAKAIIEKGITDGLGSYDISKQLRQFYDEGEKWKAMRTARTEVGAAAGKGQREAAAQSGYVTRKVWIASMDDRVRDAHAQMNGEERAFNEKYSNGLMYPLDPSGEPGEIINCRCGEGYIV